MTSVTEPDSFRTVLTRSSGTLSRASGQGGPSAPISVPPAARAALTQAQKRAGSLSPSSRLSHAIRLDRPRAAAHPAHAIVLPAPGGAVTTVTGRSVAP